jgi:hypothetical protein
MAKLKSKSRKNKLLKKKIDNTIKLRKLILNYSKSERKKSNDSFKIRFCKKRSQETRNSGKWSISEERMPERT